MIHRKLHISRFIRPLLAGALLAVGALASQAQTCRVRVSVSSNGSQVVEYREVYEYDYVWEKPQYPGGDGNLVKFINKTRRYPERAYKKGIQGRVMCSFIVNSNGSVSDVQVFKGVEQSLDKEAVRVFSLMPDWIPGKINGMPVPVRVIRTVPFRK